MRALTITQPWAGLVASGLMLVIPRRRPAISSVDFGEPFAIHAGAKIDEDARESAERIAPDRAAWDRPSRITSAVIAVATVDRVIYAPAPLPADLARWEPIRAGRIAYVLRDVCALATLDEVRPYFGPAWPGYTNPTMMFAALQSAGSKWRPLRLGLGGAALPWPRYGLARIQWEGPWTAPGVPMRARYRYTHWVGAVTRGPGDVGVWDVNAMANGSGWCALADWTRVIVPALTADYKRASGGWHITHAIERDRGDAGIGSAP